MGQGKRRMSEGCYDHVNAATSPWCIFVAAHNEERKIESCLKSIFAAEPDARPDVYVVANGCTDRTEERVLEFRRGHASVHLVTIRRGDKCNAWNEFIHDVVPGYCGGRDLYFFMDGDVRVTPGSFRALAATLDENVHAHAASGLPVSGRSVRQAREGLMTGRNIMGNLYALRGEFVRRIQEMQIRLPRGLEGDDGIIATMAKFDLFPIINKTRDDQRIEPCLDAGFEFDSLRLLSIRDWRLYYRRLVRYARRQFEFDLMRPVITRCGFKAMPAEIAEIYCEGRVWRPPAERFYHPMWNWLALREMRRRARAWHFGSRLVQGHKGATGADPSSDVRR